MSSGGSLADTSAMSAASRLAPAAGAVLGTHFYRLIRCGDAGGSAEGCC